MAIFDVIDHEILVPIAAWDALFAMICEGFWFWERVGLFYGIHGISSPSPHNDALLTFTSILCRVRLQVKTEMESVLKELLQSLSGSTDPKRLHAELWADYMSKVMSTWLPLIMASVVAGRELFGSGTKCFPIELPGANGTLADNISYTPKPVINDISDYSRQLAEYVDVYCAKQDRETMLKPGVGHIVSLQYDHYSGTSSRLPFRELGITIKENQRLNDARLIYMFLRANIESIEKYNYVKVLEDVVSDEGRTNTTQHSAQANCLGYSPSPGPTRPQYVSAV
ncbi:hypothetical protein Bbelb_245710 [Branchiostoma belcheri]|nr:hypothetical protein Bbelb_245710 [Branchiostoma belcheri]